jgi:hypothetical protein
MPSRDDAPASEDAPTQVAGKQVKVAGKQVKVAVSAVSGESGSVQKVSKKRRFQA